MNLRGSINQLINKNFNNDKKLTEMQNFHCLLKNIFHKFSIKSSDQESQGQERLKNTQIYIKNT